MPLPKLEYPTYELILPSSKKKIAYRPYLVKEEKMLLMAQESDDAKQILQSLKNLVNTCTFEKLNVDEMTTYDFEYVFLKLRASSVGEVADIKLKCVKCEALNDISINLNDVDITFSDNPPDNKIQLTDNIGVILKSITMKDVEKISDPDKLSDVDALSIYIDTIYDNDKMYPVKDVDSKELEEFIDSLGHNQINQIRQFVENQPRLEHTVEFECKECGHKNSIVLKGIQSFFA